MWMEIPGFEGHYEVSDSGQIRSVKRTINDTKGHVYVIRERILKPNKTKNGYLIVHLCLNGKRSAFYVHRLVAEAFIPNPDNLPTVNHEDGNKENCYASNLVWATYSDNNQHAYDTRLKLRGEGHYNSKLTEENVREIKKLGKYDTFQKIADKYGVTKGAIRSVLIGESWQTIS